MPRLQSFTPLLRSPTAPSTLTCRQHFRFSTATTLCAEKSSAKPKRPLKSVASAQAPPTPATPQEASRAADLAAAEAVAESDSAQPPEPEPKPKLPSQRPATSNTAPTSKADALPTPPSKLDTANTEAALKQAAKNRAASAISIELPPPKYHVARSANRNLPIYTDYKRGGNLRLTTVRKISGDLCALRDELRVYLNKKSEEVKINSVTSHVIVKGHHSIDIEKFLAARGM